MAKLYDLSRMTTATTGTGTITLGSAVTGFLSFAGAGISDGDVIDYAINDPGTAPTASEIGTGTYTASGTTLTRTVTKSTNSNSAINLSGNAHVFISPRAETLGVFTTSWTPSITTTGTVGTPAYSTQFGTYERVGNLVVAQFVVQLSGWTGSPTGNVQIAGLPIANNSTTNNFSNCFFSTYSVAGLAASNYSIAGRISSGATVIDLFSTGNAGASNITAAQAGTTCQFFGTAVYHQ